MAPDLPKLPRPSTSTQMTSEPAKVEVLNEEEEDVDDEILADMPDDLTNWADRETVSYVVGAFVRRLDCQSCKETLRQETPSTSNFTSLMTYASATMFYPKECVVDSFFCRLKPIFCHFEKHFLRRTLLNEQ